MPFHCSPSLGCRLLLLASERGPTDFSYPEGQEEERDESEEDGAVQVVLDVAHQSIGWRELGRVIWKIHNGDRVPKGGVESCIETLADSAAVALACAVGELDREFLPPIWSLSPAFDWSHGSNDCLSCNALPEEVGI